MSLRNKISDKELQEMILAGHFSETRAIRYLLKSNIAAVTKLIKERDTSLNEVKSVLNEALFILVTNIKKGKFRNESTLSTYFIGICKHIAAQSVSKRQRYTDRVIALDEEKMHFGTLSPEIQRFEELNSQKMRLQNVLAQISEKCKKVLLLWSQGYSMTEIANSMEYKNAQIAMNKKNTCLKAAIKKTKS